MRPRAAHLASLNPRTFELSQTWNGVNCMPKSKFIRIAAALLMIIAMVMPVSPGLAAEEVDDSTVAAYHLPGGVCGPIQGPTPAAVVGCTLTPVGGGENTGSVPASFTYVAQRNDATYDRAECPAVNETTGTPGISTA